MTLHLCAAAVWTPRYPSLAAWHARAATEPGLPAADVLGARARGRASMLTRMVCEVATVAAQAAGAELARIPLIAGSAYGEMAITTQLLMMMNEGDGALSPARFQSSVHNAAAGLLSIATGNQGFSTCIAAGDATAAALLLEAQAWLAEHGGEVLVAMADERLPDFFAHNEPFQPAAAALVLSSAANGALATLSAPVRSEGAARADHPELGPSPVAPLFALLDAVHARAPSVRLPAFGPAWSVALGYGAP